MAGRPPKTNVETIATNEALVEDKSVDTTTVTNVDKEKEELKAKNEEMAKMMEQMQVQLTLMQKQMLSGAVEPKKEKTNKKVKVVNLLNNKLNLSTQGFGNGKVFEFLDFGSSVSMNIAYLEEILSIGEYRRQAEEGYFYICDSDIVEEMDLTDAYESIHDKKAIEYISTLADDSCVDMFCGLSATMKESVATLMAEKINSGKPLDRNRLASIQMKSEVDIESMAKSLKEISDRASK